MSISDKKYIVLHHSATADGQTVSWGAIRRYHTSWKHNGLTVTATEAKELQQKGESVEAPWRDIGYHFGIELVGDHYEVLAGRMMGEEAAACWQAGMNKLGLHICLVGNFDPAPPPEAQWNLGLTLVRSLQQIFNIADSRVVGHRQFAPKTCPGTKFDLDAFRADLARGR